MSVAQLPGSFSLYETRSLPGSVPIFMPNLLVGELAGETPIAVMQKELNAQAWILEHDKSEEEIAQRQAFRYYHRRDPRDFDVSQIFIMLKEIDERTQQVEITQMRIAELETNIGEVHARTLSAMMEVPALAAFPPGVLPICNAYVNDADPEVLDNL